MAQNPTFTAFFATPADEVKEFSRPGGFKGKSVSPYYLVKRLTERFGLCGKGWRVKHYETRVVESPKTGVVAVYVLLSLLYKEQGDTEWNEVGPHYGGDVAFDSVKLERQRKNADGSFNAVECDDEAFKKAYTDAFSKCCSWLGLGGDIHDGLCDGNKYLNNTPWDVDLTKAKKAAVADVSTDSGSEDDTTTHHLDDKIHDDPPQDEPKVVNGWTLEKQGLFATLAQTDLKRVFVGSIADKYQDEADKWAKRRQSDPPEKVIPALGKRIAALKAAMAQAPANPPVATGQNETPPDSSAQTPTPGTAQTQTSATPPTSSATKPAFQREADYGEGYADAAKAAFQKAALRFETTYKTQNLTDPQGLTKQMIAKVKETIKFGILPNETQDERRMMLANALNAEADKMKIP